MKKVKHIKTPLSNEVIAGLKAGDEALLSGAIYTARDQAHLRMSEMIKKKQALPFILQGKTIYYCGPTPSPGRIIGSCGPTTSSRMDLFTPEILKSGVKALIGKGTRSREVRDAIKRYGAVYFIAPGGAGAYLCEKVESCELIAFEDLGPEAVYKLEIKDFPVVVAIDSKGNDIYSR
ncbi:MAG: FumA C-terminus/TtdB family hydratase beta subunit [Candidatus Omnitrophota bacterium]